MQYAPVVIFVYNRPNHTRLMLDALSNNVLANESEIYVFSDGVKNFEDSEEQTKINEVREICKLQAWAKNFHIIESDINMGLAKSVISGINKVFEKHDKVIVLEDDIITAPYFLKYMNDSLVMYEESPKVFGVSGYKYPSEKPINKLSYFLPIASSWSYGVWKDRWGEVDFDGARLLKEIESKGLIKTMNFGNYPFYEMLKDQVLGKNNSWAIRFYASMFLNDCYFLFPGKSLVENVGFDDSGTHCSTDDFFSRIRLSTLSLELEYQTPKLDKNIVSNI